MRAVITMFDLRVVAGCDVVGAEPQGMLAKRRELHFPIAQHVRVRRSEEHTSELQSLMRISYAVFCLKKKNKNQHITIRYSHKYRHTHQHSYDIHTLITNTDVHSM